MILRTLLDLAVFAVCFPFTIMLVRNSLAEARWADLEGMGYVIVGALGAPMLSVFWLMAIRWAWVGRLADRRLREELCLASVPAEAWLAERTRSARRSLLLCQGLPLFFWAWVLRDLEVFLRTHPDDRWRIWIAILMARQVAGWGLASFAIHDRLARLCRPGSAAGSGSIPVLIGVIFLMLAGPFLCLAPMLALGEMGHEEFLAPAAWALAIATLLAARHRKRTCARDYYRFES